MNSRAENANIKNSNTVLEEIKESLRNGEIENFETEDNDGIITISYDAKHPDDFGYVSRSIYPQNTETVPSLYERVLMDEKASFFINKDAFVIFLYNHIDVNSLQSLEAVALVWDDEETESLSREELCDWFGDEYAFEIATKELGCTWVERSIVIINISELIKSSVSIANEPGEWRTASDIFKEGLIQTVCHECRHLLYECAEFVPIGPGTPYPATGGVEDAVEEYGNMEAERLLRDKTARELIERMIQPDALQQIIQKTEEETKEDLER